MAKHRKSRRDILKASIAVGIAAVGVDCRRPRAPRSDLRTDLRNLLLSVGPWQHKDESVAADFLRRYLSDERGKWLAPKPDDIRALAARLPKNAVAIEQIDLSSYSTSQRQMLENLVENLYGDLEIRCFMAGQPPPGVCAL